MQVTRHNFKACLPAVREALAAADFFAIDCEMTGLHVQDNRIAREGKAPTFLDDAEDRYEEVREAEVGRRLG